MPIIIENSAPLYAASTGAATATVPFTWASGDYIGFTITYDVGEN